MKRAIALSIIHLLLSAIALAFGVSRLQAQDLEIVPYRLTPSNDVHCPINVELVEPVTLMAIPDIYKEEIVEILIDRVVFEETHPFAVNEPFHVDDKLYQLVRIPNTGDSWYYGTWNHAE